jgi:hypothetical protein
MSIVLQPDAAAECPPRGRFVAPVRCSLLLPMPRQDKRRHVHARPALGPPGGSGRAELSGLAMIAVAGSFIPDFK